MTVYIVTSGEYSDYGIDAVFTKKETADMYANLKSDRRVETYEADSVSVMYKAKDNPYSVTYDIIEDRITSMYPTVDEYAGEDFMNDTTLKDFYLCVYPSKRVYEDMAQHSWGSELLLKIVRDRFAKYCTEHETSREELIKAKKKRDAEFYEKYPMYRTSGDGLFNPYFKADQVCNAILKDLIRDGIQLPTGEELRETYRQIVKKTVEENVSIDEHD